MPCCQLQQILQRASRSVQPRQLSGTKTNALNAYAPSLAQLLVRPPAAGTLVKYATLQRSGAASTACAREANEWAAMPPKSASCLHCAPHATPWSKLRHRYEAESAHRRFRRCANHTKNRLIKPCNALAAAELGSSWWRCLSRLFPAPYPLASPLLRCVCGIVATHPFVSLRPTSRLLFEDGSRM